MSDMSFEQICKPSAVSLQSLFSYKAVRWIQISLHFKIPPPNNVHYSATKLTTTVKFLEFDSFVFHWQLFSLEGKHHYWPLACFFNLNGWSERCNTFGHLIVQMDAAWGYFSPFPHEWACQFILASGVYITEVNDNYDNKCILFSQLLLFIFSIFLLFYGLYYVISLICIIQVDFLTTYNFSVVYYLYFSASDVWISSWDYCCSIETV